jgi:hypothetical protein
LGLGHCGNLKNGMMKTIFNNYTGSPFINNSLQAIEALAELDDVSEITTDTLLELYKKHKLWELFKRMKSYSMLFSRNGPLLNDKEFGDKIYRGIFEYTLNNFETKGQYQCEISGLRFDTSFSKIYENVLYEVKYPVRKIEGKDKTINRCWFPLTGALGSDAQALPQAKFDIQIHPICLVIIQFLSFSALLYKGRILLLDTVNFTFSKDFISESVERVLREIEITSDKKSIQNIRDFSQGDYILKAIRIYTEKNMDYESYTDLNLWSFSNSGTGASCEIDRIPNKTFKTLYELYRTNSKCQEDLKNILQKSSARFLEYLIEGKDYYGLYPRKVQRKKGKKTETIKLEGVSVEFFETYQKAIGNDKFKDYAKYIAYLISIDKDLKDSEIKLLDKFEPYREAEYNTLIYGVLLRAAKRGQWSLQNHLEILDKTDDILIKSWIYGIFKMVHFYYYKNTFLKECPITQETEMTSILSTIIHLIEQDRESERSIKRLQDNQNYQTFNINKVFVRNCERLSLGSIVSFVYDDFRPRRNDLNKLLRMYFNQSKANLDFKDDYFKSFEGSNNKSFKTYQLFVELFQAYYLEKYNHDVSKYERHILKLFPKTPRNYKFWINDVIEKMSAYSRGDTNLDFSQIRNFEEELFYAPNGEYNISFSRFAIEFLLNKHFLNHFQTKKF